MAQNPPGNARTARDVDLMPGLGRSPGGGTATHPVFLPGEFHRQEPDWLQTMGSQRLRHDSSISTHTHCSHVLMLLSAFAPLSPSPATSTNTVKQLSSN